MINKKFIKMNKIKLMKQLHQLIKNNNKKKKKNINHVNILKNKMTLTHLPIHLIQVLIAKFIY